MKVIFRFQDVFEIVKNDIPTLEESANEAQRTTKKYHKKKDCKALFLIHQCVDEEIFENIVECETAINVWDTLAKTYLGIDNLKEMELQTLMRQYELLHM